MCVCVCTEQGRVKERIHILDCEGKVESMVLERKEKMNVFLFRSQGTVDLVKNVFFLSPSTLTSLAKVS